MPAPGRRLRCRRRRRLRRLQRLRRGLPYLLLLLMHLEVCPRLVALRDALVRGEQRGRGYVEPVRMSAIDAESVTERRAGKQCSVSAGHMHCTCHAHAMHLWHVHSLGASSRVHSPGRAAGVQRG